MLFPPSHKGAVQVRPRMRGRTHRDSQEAELERRHWFLALHVVESGGWVTIYDKIRSCSILRGFECPDGTTHAGAGSENFLIRSSPATAIALRSGLQFPLN
jgi:hypothetical protein